ncbi:hypothetical protein NIES4074_61550 (plasmid) [Cylindrospermum sp. NIES-4074]|nr:hypothetical protein NIES4074_61550 [Cylindrospermum sp. NIES-4074]
MGKVKRRKQLDPNWSLGPSEIKPINQPEITYLTEEDSDYLKALELKNRYYNGKNFVYLVRLDYLDGESYVGAVHAFLRGSKIAVNAMWFSNPSNKRNGEQIIKNIAKRVGLKMKEELKQADIVIVE